MKRKPAYYGVYNLYIKRILDIIIASVALFVTWPLFFVIGAAIAIETGFPVFYRAPRGGYLNRPFQVMKFRTMVQNADKIGGSTTALHDSRITKVGNILRKTKLDELPQFIQVFSGEMSIIGPRPELLQYTEKYTGREKAILKVKPGITDFSSVRFINLDEIVGGENADEMYEKYVLKKKNQLRIKYAYQVSFATDVYIFLATVSAVLDKAYGFLVKKEHR